MKALVEIALIWGIVLALILAAFLLNLWLVHLVELLVGAKGTWGIIVAAAVMATGWIFSFGSKRRTNENFERNSIVHDRSCRGNCSSRVR